MSVLNQKFTAVNRAHRAQQKTGIKMAALWREFGAEVRKERKQRKWSLAALASKMGIGKSMLGYLETHGRDWSMELALRAVKELGL